MEDLKRGKPERDCAKTIVERGDSTVRTLFEELVNWSPKSFRLSESEVESLVGSLPVQQLQVIRFAKKQVRKFARIQRDFKKVEECETLPGMIPGHRSIPVQSVDRFIQDEKFCWWLHRYCGLNFAYAGSADNQRSIA